VVEGAKSAVLGSLLAHLEARHGVLSMVDVVLNHTSVDSGWLARHPEAAYSLRNSPHLRAAFELDEAMLRAREGTAERGSAAQGPGVSVSIDARLCSAEETLALLEDAVRVRCAQL
jgi:hypothetical protein